MRVRPFLAACGRVPLHRHRQACHPMMSGDHLRLAGDVAAGDGHPQRGAFVDLEGIGEAVSLGPDAVRVVPLPPGPVTMRTYR